MWLISCSTGLLGDRRIWLRPTSTHLFGRTSGRTDAGIANNFIDNRSVSRKHLLIEVGDAPSSDSGLVHKRTELRLTDDSVHGTRLGDERFKKGTKVLGGSSAEGKDVYELTLGNYEGVLKLEWVDVVLTCSQLKKKKASGPDTLEEKRSQLKGSDVKIVTDWLPRKSTHSVSRKRNTPIVLQALLQAKWVVGYGFVDALADAIARPTPEKICLLEDDFDAHWPKEADYGTPPQEGKEDAGDDLMLLPNAERLELFVNYTFVFLRQEQLDNLMPVITIGGGKAVVCEAQAGQTDKVIAYVKQLAGKKIDSSHRLSQYPGNDGIVIVRSNLDHGRNEINEPIEVALDQRGVEQNELIDIVLTMDTSLLTRRLPERSQIVQPGVDEDDVAVNSVTGRSQRSQREQQQRMVRNTPEDSAAEEQPSQSAQPEPKTPAEPRPVQPRPAERPAEQQTITRKQPRWKRQPFRSTFEGFGEYDVSQFAPAPTQQSDIEPSAEDSAQRSQAQSERSIDVDSTSQAVNGTQRSTRKRSAPSEEPAESEQDTPHYLQGRGQEALKRRKTEAAKAGVSSFSRAAAEADKAAQERAALEKKSKDRQIDVKAELAKRREEEEGRRRKDEEALKELHGIDPTELENLAKIETFEIPVREHTPSQAAALRSDRWDPKWDGRMNFKRFRPKGQREPVNGAAVNSAGVTRTRRVIVTLEEVPRRGHGLGDEYWLETERDASPNARGRNSQKKTQSQSQSARAGRAAAANDGESAGFSRRIQRSREEDAEQESLTALGDEELPTAPPDGKSQPSSSHPMSTLSQTLGTKSQRKAAGKRPAAEQGGPAAKKPKAATPKQSGLRNATTASRAADDDDEDEELKFRRRNR